MIGIGVNIALVQTATCVSMQSTAVNVCDLHV